MADTRSETRKRFDTEFAAARKRGDKTFDFDGKSIAVKLADETPSAKKMRDLGYDASGNQAPLRNIPKLSTDASEARYTPSKVSAKDSLSEGEELMKRGGKVKSAASKRADGIATKGFTKGRMV
jgi:hypothetical protein